MQLRLSIFVFVALIVGACGGGKTERPDPPDQPDAPVTPTPDAPVVNPPAQGLGKVCMAPADCPAGAPICAQLSAGAANGFCTLICGSTAAGSMTPPANGNAMCQASMPAPGAGTVGCVLTAQPMGGMMSWACGIGCGDLMGMNLGGCPGGLTCTANLCQ